jgi:hypothetical protein
MVAQSTQIWWSSQLGAIFGDDGVWQSKPVDDVREE